MKPVAAIDELEALISSREELYQEPTYLEWTAKAAAVLRASFGADSDQVRQFVEAAAVKREGYTLAGSPARDREAWRGDASHRAKAILKAAVFTLRTVTAEDSPLDEASIDPELWGHVQGLVLGNDWAKVPAAVAIFVEDKVRTWAGDPRQGNGATSIGKALYATALNSTGSLRLGRQESEQEGWRALGTGLAQAVGNVDRHRIQRRDDVRRYAMGVLGLGSLLLTQLRYEHPAVVQETEAAQQASDEAGAAPGGAGNGRVATGTFDDAAARPASRLSDGHGIAEFPPAG